ncbi:ferredoxin reductase [Mycobacterium sp. CVI_P3]|uniref:Ferredoxin reductase n=1 Tax=Mycobacterium pinniadriaticum TaxID=2994102 RepID=A0ABT3S8N5_9MYCO|nr:ferredoxin reductase [Mycobacterium pinniadriaticum]MCX2929104.1 ferredoxin reductase [Mycobacterium pinniadriaticum]MCX2935529.1 ferredoxin reductase [Mycobacterium pinniadriaticum]
MFTKTLTKKVLRSPLVDLLTGPHGVDRYTELVDPTWTTDARAKVVDVRRTTPRSVTLFLAPNTAVTGYRAGQHLNLTVEIDGRRHTRCYSPASAEGSSLIELTIGRHDGGLVSSHLYRHARPGMVVGLSAPAGDFVLPDRRPRRILLVSGGSGITPVMSMVRTLLAEHFDGEIVFVHYARTPLEACYRTELTGMPIRVLHGYTRSPGGELTGRFGADHLRSAMADPDVVYVCGPPALVEAVREHCPNVLSESFVPTRFVVPDGASGGRITFRDSGINTEDDGRPLLDQAEGAGLNPTSGCRMGICHTCTRRKHRGAVRNVTTGAISTADEEDVQICVSVPVGDVEIAL